MSTQMKTLIVDDDRMVNRFVAKVAARLGFDVEACDNGLAAMERLEETFFPLIVSDIYMPGMTGLEFCRELRSRPDGRFAVVLVMTACDRKENLQAVLEAGADDYMTKPIELDHLKARLAIARKHAEARAHQWAVERELQAAKDRAEAANRAKTDFLANMSHDLRTPLNGILGYAQILLQSGRLDDRQRDSVEIIHHSGEHLLTMINDVLDLSKIEARKMDLDRTPFALDDFLERIAEMARGQIRARGKRLDFRLERIGDLPRAVLGDEIRLRQVLLNLLGNAVKYTDSGWIEFRVRRLDTDRDGDTASLRFTVADTGIGIAPDQREAIFLPFHQAGDAALRSEGTGLGLSICRRLVTMMGGRLQLDGEPGRGSRFWFEVAFPAAPECPPRSPATSVARIRGEGRRVLIADDLPENRRILREMLEASDFVVREAAHGREAVAMALADPPDLILLDLVMPDMDGFRAARILRENPVLRDVPRIAVSANVFEPARRKSREAGFAAFLPKPVRMAELLALLREQLGLEAVPGPSPERPLPAAGPDREVPAEWVRESLDRVLIGDIPRLKDRLAALTEAPALRRVLSDLADQFDLDGLQAEPERRLSPSGSEPSPDPPHVSKECS